MADPNRQVECPSHGLVGPAFVCRHLAAQVDGDGPPIGFFEPHSPPENPQAWCAACEQVRSRESDWNDASEAFAGITFICSGCFAELRRRELGAEPS